MSWPPELAQWLREAPRLDGARFNPVRLLRPANGLHEAGEAAALEKLRAYLNAPDGPPADARDEQVLLIARLLFVPQDAGHDALELRVGMPSVGADHEPQVWPHFPLAIEGDVPFLLVEGYTVGGLPEPAAQYLDRCARSGRLRDRPLAPSLSPTEAVEKLLASPRGQALLGGPGAEGHAQLLRRQARRAAGEEGAPATENGKGAAPRGEGKNLRWDAEQQRFVPPDGRPG